MTLTPLPSAVRDYLLAIVRKRAPARLLLVCRDRADGEALTATLDTHVDTCVVAIVDDAVPCWPASQPRYDLAVVVDALGAPSASGQRLLGQLRDTRAAAVLALVGPRTSPQPTWAIADFIALGFRRSPDSHNLASGWACYRYDIHDYKITPGWLNSRYWANPGRWDEERW